jgi:hypothetical protein
VILKKYFDIAIQRKLIVKTYHSPPFPNLAPVLSVKCSLTAKPQLLSVAPIEVRYVELVIWVAKKQGLQVARVEVRGPSVMTTTMKSLKLLSQLQT